MAEGFASQAPARLWLGELDRAYADGTECNTYPPEIRQRLIDVLGVEPGRNGTPGLASIAPTVANLLKNGAFGTSQPYTATS